MFRTIVAVGVFALTGIAGLPGAPAASSPQLCVLGQPCPSCQRDAIHRPHICPN